MNDEPVAWIDFKELDMDVSTSVTKNKQFEFDMPLYTSPQKYCPSENNEAYEKGFIDGMAKQRDSAVQRFVEGGTPDSELKALVKSFFEDYLDYQEESDSGRVFNPIHISCTRVMMTKPLGELLDRMKELSGAK
jgi:hypothetical protein